MSEHGESPQAALESLANQAIKVAQTARRHKHSLRGAGFYATKLASLRTEAEIQYRALTHATSSDGSSLRSHLNGVFGAATDHADRVDSKHGLIHELKTEWHASPLPTRADDGLFPISLLEQTRRGYLRQVGIQMNGAFNATWYDAAAVMMRRLLETAIIEAFEANGLDAKIKDSNGDFLHLTELVECAVAETAWNLGRDTKKDYRG